MNLREFTEWADQVVTEQIPPELLTDLNMGMIVEPDEKEEDDGDSVVLGEYVRNELGNQVILYYGSFRTLWEEGSLPDWKEEVADTIRHELRHHVEGLAGEEILARQEDQQELSRIRERKQAERQERRKNRSPGRLQSLWQRIQNRR